MKLNSAHFQQILLIIDAIDECSNRSEGEYQDEKQKREGRSTYSEQSYRESLLKLIGKIFKSDVGVIKFIVISRPETDILTAFRGKLEVFA